MTPGHDAHSAVLPPHTRHSHSTVPSSVLRRRARCAHRSPHQLHQPSRLVAAAFAREAVQSYTRPEHLAHERSSPLANASHECDARRVSARATLLVKRFPRHLRVGRAHPPHACVSPRTNACLRSSRHHEHRPFGSRSARASLNSAGESGHLFSMSLGAPCAAQKSSSPPLSSPWPRAKAPQPGRRHGSVRREHPPHLCAARASQSPSATRACAVSQRHQLQRAIRTWLAEEAADVTVPGEAYSTLIVLREVSPRRPRRGARSADASALEALMREDGAGKRRPPRSSPAPRGVTGED